MFKNILKYLVVAASVCLVACSQDDEPITVGDSMLVTVADAGYSRATENGLTTVFTKGDKIGVFAVKNGTIQTSVNNLCLTAVEVGESLAWKADEGQTLESIDGATYYAYYPYRETLNGKPNAAARNAEEFFNDIVENWSVELNQSKYDDYTASDLMTASATPASNMLSFAMNHRMALIKIFFPAQKYVFDNTPAIPDYVIKSSSQIKFNNGAKPLAGTDGSHMLLVNPSNSENLKMMGSYNNGTEKRNFNFTSAATSGTVNTYRIDGGAKIINHTLAVGDFFLSDGSLLSKDTPEQQVKAADVMGIVYNIDPNRIGDAEKDALGGVVHGSVMATLTVSEPYNGSFAWGTANFDETSIGMSAVLGSDGYETAEKALVEISGYNDFNLIATGHSNYTDYEAIYYTSLFGKDRANYDQLLKITTGWYLPAFGQVVDFCNNLGKGSITAKNVTPSTWADVFFWAEQGTMCDNINATMSKVASNLKTEIAVNHWYWSSTQISAQYANIYNITNSASSTLQTLNFSGASKDKWNRTRAVLTF